MARLVSWPVGLRPFSREPLTGPRTVGASSGTSIGGFAQSSSAAFGLWRYRFDFPPIRGEAFRRYRGWVTSLHGGGNATRVDFCDWDGLSFADAGATISQQAIQSGLPWDNSLPWNNGRNWRASRSPVLFAEPAAVGAVLVALGDDRWGHGLDIGDLIGVTPNHFGKYMITEVLNPGEYRIWPPLRRAVTTDDYATLQPVMAMRLESEDAANAPRGASFAEGLSVTLVEVLDYDVRDYFGD